MLKAPKKCPTNIWKNYRSKHSPNVQFFSWYLSVSRTTVSNILVYTFLKFQKNVIHFFLQNIVAYILRFDESWMTATICLCVETVKRQRLQRGHSILDKKRCLKPLQQWFPTRVPRHTGVPWGGVRGAAKCLIYCLI